MNIFTLMKTINKIIKYTQSKRALNHVIFWVVILLLNIPREFILGEDPVYAILIMDMCILTSQILASYFFAYYVIPNFLLKKKYVLSVLLFVIGVYVFSVLDRIMVVHVGETLVRTPPFRQEPILEILTDWKKLLAHYAPSLLLVMSVFLFVKYFIDYRKIKERDLLLSKEKSESELKVLKAQLNPHFLFNTLNNIYSLSLSNSPKTPTSIGKLSEMLDYVLYSSNTKLVLLSNEIKLIENYIELEKLRYDSRLKVVLINNVEKEINIPPLILLSLVENAFKHGAGEDSGSPEIKMEFLSLDNSFMFKISNTTPKNYVLEKESIGLSNVRKQLDLIYQNQYSLTIENKGNKFTVILKINSN